MLPLTTAARVALVVILIYVAFLVAAGLSLPHEVFKPLFSEDGPFERMSIVLWALLGLLLLLHDARSPRVLALAVLALLFAAREADLHKAFTDLSITKIAFYLRPGIPLIQKFCGGLVLLGGVALVVLAARLFYRHVVRDQGLRTPLGQLLLLPAVLLPVSKIVDRFASQLYELFGIRLPQMVSHVVGAFEEGIEMALPVLFIVALLLYRGQRREAEENLAALASPPLASGRS